MKIIENIQLDALTQMPNRTGWHVAAQKGLDAESGLESGCSKAVLFIDLDRFKWVNDTLGHDAGDQLLQKVARLIESNLVLQGELPDVAGRFGGDEFVVLLQNPDSMESLETVSNSIVTMLSQPICLEGLESVENVEVEIGASIGIAVFPQDALRLSDLLKLSDLAMYRAKHSGRNGVVFYKPEMMRQIERRRLIQTLLRQALKQHSLALDYIPLFDGQNQSVAAIEAKLNLKNSAALQNLDKADLLSIADESQVAILLGEWMVKEALSFNRRLLQSGIEMPCILEIRPSHFQQKEFVNWLAEQLEHYEVPPELLIVSLNETCLNSQRFSVRSQLTALSKLGIEIAVQAFGSGNWSLLRLHDWPIDRLHLSPLLVQEISHSTSIAVMTGSLIELGLTLNKKVIAYGVLTAEQMVFLQSHGCYLMQGQYLSDARPAEEIEVYLLQNLIGNMTELSPYHDVFADESDLEDNLDQEIQRRINKNPKGC